MSLEVLRPTMGNFGWWEVRARGWGGAYAADYGNPWLPLRPIPVPIGSAKAKKTLPTPATVEYKLETHAQRNRSNPPCVAITHPHLPIRPLVCVQRQV